MRSWTLRSGAWASIAAAAAVYLLMLTGYRQDWGWLSSVDHAALNASYDIAVKHPGWIQFWDGISTVFAPTVLRIVAMVVAVVALVRRRWRAALFLLAAVETSGTLTVLAKGSVNRPRPLTALVSASSSSFPSGHAMGAMIGFGALLVVVVPLVRSRRARMLLLGVGIALVAAVGTSRVALNVHHPSDVVAGWALGWAYLTAWALLIKPWSGRGEQTKPAATGQQEDCCAQH